MDYKNFASRWSLINTSKYDARYTQRQIIFFSLY